VFQGAGGTLQVHDFNPAEENGLFWTIPLHHGDARANFDGGTASLSLRNFEIDDYGNVGNALSGGKEIATAELNVQLHWSGLTRSVSFTNSTLPTRFRADELQGVNSGATMSWSAVENGAHITGAANTADFAVLARERNGVFF
jgi:hypothetical protein